MMLNKMKLECPRCHWIFEMAPPDSEHLVLSVQKPHPDKILNEVKEISHVCRNQRCKEAFVVYSYTPIDFFKRV